MRKYAVVLILSVIWAVYYFAVGIVNKLVSTVVTGTFVRAEAFVILTVLMLFGARWKSLRCTRRQLPRLLLVGTLGFLLDITAFIGTRYGQTGIGTVLLKSDVLMVCVISAVLYREKISKRVWLFILIMIGGMIMVLGLDPAHIEMRPTDIFFILSALFVSVNAFVIKSLQKDGVQNIAIAYYNNAVTMLLFIGFLVLSGGSSVTAVKGLDLKTHGILLVAAVKQVLVYVFYYRALKSLPVWLVKVILLLVPVVTLTLDALLLQKLPTALQLGGTLVVLLSAVTVLLEQRKKDAL